MLDTAALCSGVAAARRVVDFLDGRSESPANPSPVSGFAPRGPRAESAARVVHTDGVFVARVFREELGVVGEFDGMGEYGAGDPGSTAETVRQEKLREDAIRDLGVEVVRWTWPELFRFDVVEDRVARAAERALHPHPPTMKTPARCRLRAAVDPACG